MKLLLHLITFLALLLPATVVAQVTIGSERKALEGSLLTLTQGDVTTKGMMLPRVVISKMTPATDEQFKQSIGNTSSDTWVRLAHTGLMVYNVGDPANPCYSTGIYTWSGELWQLMTENNATEPIVEGSYEEDIAALVALKNDNPGNTLGWTNADPEKWISDATAWKNICGQKRLVKLNVGSKKLTSANALKQLTALAILTCNGNDFVNLDLSKNKELTNLTCSDKSITSLDLSNNLKLVDVSCGGALLTSINLPATKTLTRLRVGDSGSLTAVDLSKITALAYLTISSTKVTRLDLTPNKELLAAEITANDKLIDLNLLANAKLQTLKISGSGLTTLDLTGNIALKSFASRLDNSLLSLDFTHNVKLESLICEYNANLSTINLEKNILLNTITVNYHPKLEAIDLSGNPNLTYIFLKENALASLDVTKNTLVTRLYCNNNKIPSVDLSENLVLTELDISNNLLQALDLTTNTVLKALSCANNNIQGMKFDTNTVLTDAYYINNPNLGNMDTSKNPDLWSLGCSNTGVTDLDISNNLKLVYLYCQSNAIDTIDVHLHKDLRYLFLDSTNIEYLDLEHNENLLSLTVSYCVKLAPNFTVKYVPNLYKLECAHMGLKTIDLSKSDRITDLSCNNNYFSQEIVDEQLATLPGYCYNYKKFELFPQLKDDGNWNNSIIVPAPNCRPFPPGFPGT